MSELTFDFHGLAGFSLQTEDARAVDFYQGEFGPVRGPLPASAPQVSLTWNSREGRAGGFRASHKVLSRWSYRLDWQPRHFRIMAAGNRLALPMVHHMLVHHALRLMASQDGTLMLHASGVVRAGRSLLLTGGGGMGKTTTSSLLLRWGSGEWRPHADDYAFLRDGTTYAYPTRSHLYRDLLRWVPDIAAQLSWRQRMELQLLGRLRRWTRDGVKWPVRVPAETLWPGREPADSARLAAVVVLSREAVDEPRLSTVGRPEEVVPELIEMNFGEARHFLRLVDRASGSASSWQEAWVERERELLLQALQTTAVRRLAIPRARTPSPALGERLVELLETLVES